jgi:hypothetical protein
MRRMLPQEKHRTAMKITLEYIKSKCRMVGECWEWNTKSKYRAPAMNIKGKTLSPRREAWKLHRNQDIPSGYVITHKKTCGNPMCCNPEHLIRVKKLDVMVRTVSEGKLHTPAIRAKIAESKRKNSKLSQEAAKEIAYGDDPTEEAAAKHGISTAYVRMLRKGLFRKEFANPFAGLGAR